MTPYQKKKELMQKDYETRIKLCEEDFKDKKKHYERELSELTKDLRLLKQEFEEFLNEQKVLEAIDELKNI